MTTTPTLFVANGVHTMNGPDDPAANSVLVEDGHITAVGSVDELRKRTDATIFDFGGGIITPGLTDSHSHPTLGATSSAVGLDFTTAMTLAEAQERLAAYAPTVPNDAWVMAWGLNPTIYEGAPLTFAPFASIIGDRPAVLRFADGHSLLASPAVMKAAGITHPMTFASSSALIPGYPDGTLTGLVLEFEATQIINAAIPTRTFEEKAASIADVLRQMAATGLTGAHVMTMDYEDPALLAAVEKTSNLGIKLRLHPVAEQSRGTDTTYLKELIGQHGRRWSITGVKLFLDGSIDGGTAWLQEPDVNGQSDHSAWNDLDAYKTVMRDLISSSISTVAHAIGDQGVLTHAHVVSQILAELGDDGTGKHGSHSIEHLEMLDDEAVREVASSPLDVSMMPLHCTRFLLADHTDSWSLKLGDPRQRYAFRIKSLLNAGATVAIGSDWPVAPFDPRMTIADGMLRRPFEHPSIAPVVPSEALTAYELLQGYTSSCAHAHGEASTSGRLLPGYTADLTVFGADPLGMSAETIGTVPILGTVVDGELVYSSSK